MLQYHSVLSLPSGKSDLFIWNVFRWITFPEKPEGFTQLKWLQGIDVGRHFGCYLLFSLCWSCQVMLLKLVSYFTRLPSNAQPSAIWAGKEGDLLKALRNTWKLMDSVNPDPGSEGNLSFYSTEYQQGLGFLMAFLTSFQPVLPSLPEKRQCCFLQLGYLAPLVCQYQTLV